MTPQRTLLDGRCIQCLHIEIAAQMVVVKTLGFRELQTEAAVIHEHCLPPVLPVELLDVLPVPDESRVQPRIALHQESLIVVPCRQPGSKAVDDSPWLLWTQRHEVT